MANRFGKRSKKLEVGRILPPTFHKLPGDYETEKSEVINWLIQQTSIREFVWDQIKQSGDVFYNKDTGKWQGINYDN